MTNEINFDDLKRRREEEDFREMRARLQTAVRAIDVPPELEFRLRTMLAATPRNTTWNRNLMSIAAGVAVVMGLAVYQAGNLRSVTTTAQSHVIKVSGSIAAMLRVGLDQHVHCAVARNPEKPADTWETMRQYLAEYRDLLPAVRARVPAGYELLTAHKCKFRRREFVHFTFQNGGNLLSLLITPKREAESFQIEGLLPELEQAGLPMYAGAMQTYQMAGFETRDHLGYVISNLTASQNTQMASAMIPVVRTVLAKLES